AVENIQVAAQQGGLGRDAVRDHQEAQPVDQSELAPGVAVARAWPRPVVRKSRELDELVATPGGEPEGARADRPAPGAIRRDGAWVQDGGLAAIDARQGGEESRRGLVQPDPDGKRPGRLDACDPGEAAAVEF